MYAIAVSFAMVDANGDRVFDDQDIPNLGRKSLVPLVRIYRAILRLSTPMGYPETMPSHQKQAEPGLVDICGSADRLREQPELLVGQILIEDRWLTRELAG